MPRAPTLRFLITGNSKDFDRAARRAVKNLRTTRAQTKLVRRELARMRAQTLGVAKGLTGIRSAAFLAAGATGLGFLLKRLIATGSEMKKSADQVNVSVPEYQVLGRIFLADGLAADKFRRAITQLRRAQGEALDPAGEASYRDAFTRLGITIDEVREAGNDLYAVLLLLARGFGESGDEAAIAQSASDLFGARIGGQMVRSLRRGQTALRDTRKEMEAIPVTSQKAAAGAEILDQRITDIGERMQTILLNAVGDNEKALNRILDLIEKRAPPALETFVRLTGTALENIDKIAIVAGIWFGAGLVARAGAFAAHMVTIAKASAAISGTAIAGGAAAGAAGGGAIAAARGAGIATAAGGGVAAGGAVGGLALLEYLFGRERLDRVLFRGGSLRRPGQGDPNYDPSRFTRQLRRVFGGPAAPPPDPFRRPAPVAAVGPSGPVLPDDVAAARVQALIRQARLQARAAQLEGQVQDVPATALGSRVRASAVQELEKAAERRRLEEERIRKELQQQEIIMSRIGNAVEDSVAAGLDAVFDKTKSIGDALNEIMQSLFRDLARLAVRRLLDVPNLPGYATGGYVNRDGFVRLGERGAETVRLPAGSRVYPSGTDPAGAGGGNTYVFAPPIYGNPDPAQLREMLRPMFAEWSEATQRRMQVGMVRRTATRELFRGS